MADLFRFCDELGPAKVLHIHVPAPGLRAILVVDNIAAGPAIGGVRMAED
jgi:glutamate dehydrogenase (NAD(P)+)